VSPMSRLVKRTLLWACLLALPGAALADAEPIIRSSLADASAVWVGQQVGVTVELLAPGYFASSAAFDIPDPNGVLLMPPHGSPVIGNETIDGTLYTVQRHELRAWPMRPGQQLIPALSVRFQYKPNPLDTQTVPAALTTQALPLTVNVPPGAAGLGTVISARNLTVRESWQPEPGAGDVKAGSAFTRTVTFSAPDVPGMLFPPFPTEDIDGLGIYSKPQVADSEQRGEFTGSRSDSVTYVCEQPGTYTLPAVRFTWFDLDANELRAEELPERTLQVIANPDLASGVAASEADGGAAAATQTGRAPGTVLAWSIAALALAALTVVARSARGRAWLWRLSAPLRPVHLQPLHPTGSERE